MFLLVDGCCGRMGVLLTVIIFILIQRLTHWCKWQKQSLSLVNDPNKNNKNTHSPNQIDHDSQENFRKTITSLTVHLAMLKYVLFCWRQQRRRYICLTTMMSLTELPLLKVLFLVLFEKSGFLFQTEMKSFLWDQCSKVMLFMRTRKT